MQQAAGSSQCGGRYGGERWAPAPKMRPVRAGRKPRRNAADKKSNDDRSTSQPAACVVHRPVLIVKGHVLEAEARGAREP